MKRRMVVIFVPWTRRAYSKLVRLRNKVEDVKYSTLCQYTSNVSAAGLKNSSVFSIQCNERQPHLKASLKNFSYLVDPASSHMLVSKIKPCMSNYSLFDGTLLHG
ncbi:hypothetical protein PNOK_0694200 [Pyrrhoderma noxium]|uniref:Uncharacterized protein n=1 Tax=Pyrrhoderma noxium TaxID=2282107 RepID=A0A286UBD6_9AGAM|nr:hypothetical protein PNOK_0694200 [Pyrrhoderma noxium]